MFEGPLHVLAPFQASTDRATVMHQPSTPIAFKVVLLLRSGDKGQSFVAEGGSVGIILIQG